MIKKIVNILVDCFVLVLLVISVLSISMSLSSKKSGIPSVGGHAILSVASDSMKPTFEKGDMIVSNVSKKDIYKKGEVVTFKMVINDTQILNTHRISRVEKIDGVNYYHTKGDNASGEDNIVLSSDDIIGVFEGTKIDGLGKVIDTLRSQSGFFVCVVLPMILFFLWELYRFVQNLLAYNKEKTLEEASELSEEAKRRAVEEYLAQHKNKEIA